MAANIKAAQLRALAIEESAKKAAATASAPKPADKIPKVTSIPVVVKREGGAPPGPRISIADVKETRKPIAGVQLMKVVDYLKRERRDVSAEEISRATSVPVDDDLRYSLEKNAKITQTPDGKYRFKVYRCRNYVL